MMLRKNPAAVHLHVKNTTGAFDQLHLGAQVFLQVGRQPGGFWFVVSNHAVRDAYVHGTPSARRFYITPGDELK